MLRVGGYARWPHREKKPRSIRTKSSRRRRRIRCCKAWCSVKRLAMSLNAKQKPVKTEQRATSLACGWRPSPFPLRGLPKNRATMGVFGRSTSAPSIARRRKVFFQSREEANLASKRLTSRSQRFRQNPMVNCLRAWQKASSVTQPAWSHGQTPRTSPHAPQSPWVIEVVCSPTYIINHATTSGMRGRSRLGAHPPSRAAVTKTSGGRIPRNGARPNLWKMVDAQAFWNPIESMSKPPCKCPMVGGLP